MSTAENALIRFEGGRTLYPFEVMTDSGDHQTFNYANGDIVSGADGFAPDIRPNGIVTGSNLVTVAASGSNNVVDVSAFTAYSIGVLRTVAASADEAITRAATDVAVINSITMDSTGAIAVIKGIDSSDATFSEARGAAGGPPFIPGDSVEIAQVRVTTNTAGPIVGSEIFQTTGQHTERSAYPEVLEQNNIGKGSYTSASAEVNAYLKFAADAPLAHTGDTARRVYAQYYVPIAQDIGKTLDFVPSANAHTVNSTQYYGGSDSSTSTSFGAATFTARMADGIKDALVQNQDDKLTFWFYPDRNKAPYSLTQGRMGLAITNPVADQVQAAVTIAADAPSAPFSA